MCGVGLAQTISLSDFGIGGGWEDVRSSPELKRFSTRLLLVSSSVGALTLPFLLLRILNCPMVRVPQWCPRQRRGRQAQDCSGACFMTDKGQSQGTLMPLLAISNTLFKARDAM